jgi:YesN/AraC family two-component response regulator
MSQPKKHKAKILVVDDEQIVHESVKRILEAEGYRVEDAFRVDQAAAKLRGTPYDLVLTDLMMPEGNGMELVKEIAEDHPGTGVVIFTAFPTVDSAVDSMKFGALDYLPKPFGPEDLLKVTTRALDKLAAAKHQLRYEETYLQAEKAFAASLDLRELFDLICAHAVKLLNVKGSALLIFKPAKKSLEIASASGLSENYLKKGAMDVSKSISDGFQAGKPVLVPDEEFETKLQYPKEARKENIHLIVSVPMRLKDTVMGFLRIYSSESRRFEDSEIDLLTKLAEQGARALDNAMTFQQVRCDIEGMKRALTSAP